jgi:hypothetical protein
MYKGETIQGKEFYDLLVKSDEFTSALGQMTLASGRLEAEIVKYFRRCGKNQNPKSATFGSLITIGRENDLFNSNELIALNMIKELRNEFTHRVYSLFMGLVPEERLPTADLLDTDVLTYIDYALQLKENLEGMTEIIVKK